jgi:RNA polymerase sigma-70 factor (ECF subfamily)
MFREQCAYVINALRRLGVREADLEDVAHELFLVVHRVYPTYDPSRPLRPWIFGIALRMASDYRRLARVRLETTEEDPSDVLADTPHDALMRKELQLDVLIALERIPLERRGVFILHEMEGHTVPEIASALGVPLNTAYTRLRTARAEFRAAFARREADGGDHE